MIKNIVKSKSVMLAIGGLSLVLLLVVLSFDEDKPVTQAKFTPPLISVVKANAQNFSAPINLVGVTQSRWQTKLVSTVEGNVVELAAELDPGTRLSKGQVLISLASQAYQAEVDSALSRVASSELELVKIRYEQQVALQIGGKLNTAFARFEPQIDLATAEVHAAKSQLAYAQKRLADTHIRAPFDALVLQRLVTPGQNVQAGETLLTIAAAEVLDIQVPLSQSAWESLSTVLIAATVNKSLSAFVTLVNGQQLAIKLRYLEPMRDPVTRQYTLMMTLDGPYKDSGLLPEQQVALTIFGAEIEHSFKAPVSVLTQDGGIWLVDDNEKLHLTQVKVLAQDDTYVWFNLANNNAENVSLASSELTLVRYPMSHLIQGQGIRSELVDLNSQAVRSQLTTSEAK
ncbi:efflux RND transporter periplasmic adaptor subunit [Shewanella glacialipiscicola]|uniref:efflux RND transporter periplasmic adaptor subunit n=1 Tax=Shewanella glacialipiscicola TaxID=614069 RepID=UPI003D79079E